VREQPGSRAEVDDPVVSASERAETPRGAPQARSLRVNVIWAMGGNVASALSSWLLLMLLTKTATVETVGVFGLAQAIGLPVSKLLSLRLSLVQVTDAQDEFQFGHYYALRIVQTVLIVLVAGGIGFATYSRDVAIVVCAMGLSYAIIELREAFLAVAQRAERMDLMSASRVVQAILSLVCFAGLFWLTQSLLWGVIGLIVARLGTLLALDVPITRWLLRTTFAAAEDPITARRAWDPAILARLAWLALPLGIVGWLGSLFTSVPRLVVDREMGTEAVGYFTAILSLLSFGNLVIAALGQTLSPRLAVYYVSNRRAYWRLLAMGAAAAGTVGVVGVLISVLAGRQILTILFTADYAEHHAVMIWVMIAAAVLFVFSVANMALTAARRFVIQTPIYLVTALVILVASWLLIPTMGMSGAAVSLVIGYTLGTLGCLSAIVVSARSAPATPKANPVADRAD
jgi:O-antigen/teichoic acid export membrane protein